MSKHHADTTIEKLKEYLVSEEGTVELSDKQEELLRMAQSAHELFQSNNYSATQITRLLCKHYACSISKAQMVMRMSQLLFAARTVYNRNYMAALAVDEITKDMIAARARGDYDAVIRLHAAKLKAVELLPAETSPKDTPPATIVFNMFSQHVSRPVPDKQIALQEAEQIFKSLTSPQTDDYEELQPE